MSDYHIRIGQGVLEVPWWWLDALLVWLAAVGLVLWLLGRRLIRPALGAVGLIIGAAAMFALATAWIAQHWPNAPPAAFATIGGLIGGLAGFLLWRLGVGAIFALAVAIIAPIACLIATGTPGPTIEQPLVELREDLRAALNRSGDPVSETPDAAPAAPQDALGPLTKARDAVRQAVNEWWAALPNGQRWLLGTVCIGGGLLALLIGLALPYFSAALVTALLGSLMLAAPIYRLADLIGERAETALPQTPRPFLYALLIATLVGALLQWTVFRPRRKKDD